jgi:broad specificity phosphatase PhoE
MRHTLDSSESTMESRDQFANRVMSWWKKMIEHSTGSSQADIKTDSPQILIVTHGGYLNTLFRSLIGKQSQYHVTLNKGVALGGHQNCSITEMELKRGTFRTEIQVIRCGDTKHLEGGQLDVELDTNADQVM